MQDERQTWGGALRVALLIGAAFLLNSTGWLVWIARLMPLVSASSFDLLTMGVGYLMQALGTLLYAVVVTRLPDRRQEFASASIVAYVMTLTPALLASDAVGVLAFGYVANVLCGMCQGFYLHCLVLHVERGQRATTFGAAYAVSTVISWLLSLVGGSALISGTGGLATCLILTVVALAVAHGLGGLPAEGTEDEAPASSSAPSSSASRTASDSGPSPDTSPQRNVTLLAAAVVVVASIVKSAGFSFPAADLAAGVNLELSRLFYGLGLVAAGLASDRDRRYGMLCSAASLVMPFLLLALCGADAPATMLWATGYLLYGFFTVWCVILFSDLAEDATVTGLVMMSGMGLVLRHVGDSVGTALCVSLSGQPLALVIVTAVLFAAVVAPFFLLYHRMYAPAPPVVDSTEEDEEAMFKRFVSDFDLAGREPDILRRILDGQSNAEIAADLFLSASTVKYHVHHLLDKTGCKNRVDLATFYRAQVREQRNP